MLVGGIMRKIILFCATLFATVFLMSANPVHAQNVLWVGPNGSDGNACSQTSPCATFQGAINQGSVSQINCLASGNYGAVTITSSLTIDCGSGNVGNVVVSSGSGITIYATGPADIVLRHLSVTGVGMPQGAGIQTQIFNSGSLTVEDCTMQGNDYGIYFNPDRGLLRVSNSSISGNVIGVVVGTYITSEIVSVLFNRIEIVGNGSSTGLGLAGSGVVVGTLRDSLVSSNYDGVVAAGSVRAIFTVERSSIVDNIGYGIATGVPGAIINVGSSTIGGNGIGVEALEGSIISFGNNQMSTNAVNGSFTSTTPLQ
jgi:hypothetical protein